MTEQPWPDWADETVVVVATGPSAGEAPLDIARGRARVLAVKDAARLLCPWAEVLYACDHHWWLAHCGVKAYQGIRIAYDQRTLDQWRGFSFLKVSIKRAHQDMIFAKVGEIAWGGNSGFHAVNLAAQFGAKKIVLVGFDMRIDQGRHFFGQHKYTDVKPHAAGCEQWRKTLDRQAPILADRGIEVVNCSEVSALTAYPKMTLAEALA